MADRAYHRTTEAAVEAIIAKGFRDADGTWMTGRDYTGVWVTWGRPWDLAVGGLPPGAEKALLAVELPEAVFAEYEWVQEDLGYREALVPAAVLNEYPTWKAWECTECGRVDRARTHGWAAETITAGPHSVFISVCPDCKDVLAT